MKLRRLWVLLAVPLALAAQPAITDVVNAASRIPTGYPGYGIAQGALFAITGTGLGPDQIQQASFPLPTTDGLAGVTVQVTAGGTTVNAIMVYVVANEVAAILPSSTPTGKGTVTVNNNGATTTAPITVVSSAFGAFSTAYRPGFDLSPTVPAAAFNVAGDGTTTLNSIVQPAQPGQTVMLNGTGLGAISSDETQSGVTDVPNASIQVFVGTQQAAVVSEGRGACCAGLAPDYPVPQGIAAWDIIQFTVPDGVFGCLVNVTVQTGNVVSNFVTIAVSPDGSPCIDQNAVDPGDTVTLSGTVKTANISLLRNVNKTTSQGTTVEIGTETGSAQFIQYDVPTPVAVPVSRYGGLANNLNPETCQVSLSRAVIPSAGTPRPAPPPQGPQPVFLDAGAAINLKGAKGTHQLKKDKSGVYSGSLGSSFSLPGVPASNTLFLDPGSFSADDGTGGTDVSAFTVNLNLPAPAFSFTNIDQITTINRSQGVTVKWTGGDPNGYVTIVGAVIIVGGTTPGSVTLSANWACSERASAGQFTVPAFVTLGLPATPANTVASPSTLGIQSYVANRVQIPGIDLALFSYDQIVEKGLVYQ